MKNFNNKKQHLSEEQSNELLGILKERFGKNMNRHKGIEWAKVQTKLLANPVKLWSLYQMEQTGGEPDVIIPPKADSKAGEYVFYDCASESPKGRRSICYDHQALESRKEHKPENSAIQMAADMGVDVLTEAQYRTLQEYGKFDTKTSSWIITPDNIRKLGGAIFADYRYGTIFVYHNGAESYYAARGFRGCLHV